MFTQSEAHCPVKINGFLSRTAGCVQGGSPTASCILSDSFKQPSSDPAPSERAGNVKAVDDQATLVQFRYQHDLTDHCVPLNRAEGDISAGEYLSRLFAPLFRRPGLAKGLESQNESVVFHAPNVLDLLRSVK